MGPDELLNALIAATKVDDVVRATGKLDLAQVRYRVKQRYGFLFDVDEESDEPDFEGTISQALALLNGSVVGTGSRLLPGSALTEVLAAHGDAASHIEALYVRALSRLPSPDEVTMWTSFLDGSTASPDAAAPPPIAPKNGKRAQPDPLARFENRPVSGREDARARAYEDLLWTLLNSSEFVLNH
jgi:hypothetical protein